MQPRAPRYAAENYLEIDYKRAFGSALRLAALLRRWTIRASSHDPGDNL
jgi:hypothetical protein